METIGRQTPGWSGTNSGPGPDYDRPRHWVHPNLAGPTIRLLGPIDLVGAPWNLTQQQLSLLAFLASVDGAGRPSMIDALWDGRPISPGRFANLLTEVRAKIGREHLPEVADGHYRLTGIGTDLERLEVAARSGPTALGDRILLDALDLVRGTPFGVPGHRHWTWVDDRSDLATGAEVLIAESACRVAARFQARGEIRAAERACRQGLLACPLDERLITTLVELHLEQGRLDSARRLVTGWESRIRRLDCGVPPPGPRSLLQSAGRR